MLQSWALGNTVRLYDVITNGATEAPEDPGSAVTCTVTKVATGQTYNPAVASDGVGLRHADFLPDARGVYTYRFEEPDGPGLDPASAEESAFLVR